MTIEEEYMRWIDRADELPWNERSRLGELKCKTESAVESMLR